MDETDFKVHRRGGVTILATSGELDLAAADGYRAARAKAVASGLPLIIDLTDCVFIDSTGIACLVGTFQAGSDVALVGSGPQVRSVLELVGLPDLVPTFESLQQAVDHMATRRTPGGAPTGIEPA